MIRADLPTTSTIRRRGTLVVPILVVLLLSPFLIAATPVAASNTGTFEQWFNGSPSKWITGGINDNASYREGDVVPFRLPFKGLTAGAQYSFTVEYDALVRNVKGYDELKPYGTTESTDPCAGQTCTGGATHFGAFSIWGGTIDEVVPGTGTTSNNGTRHDTATVTFTAGTATPLIAWGGHLATPTTDTSADGASYISGSPLEMDTDVSGVLHLSAGAWLREPDPEPDPTCTGSITATMVDGDNVARTGGLTGSPTVTLNGTATTDVTCGDYSYTATAPEGWQLTNAATQTATVTNGHTTNLTWTVEQITCDGSITATMVDGDNVARTGGLTGSPTVTLNGTATTDVTCGDYSYTATAPAGWQFVSGTTNPQTAQIDTDGQNVTLTWTVEKQSCAGTITATMRDGAGNDVNGSLTASDGAPTVNLNGTTTDVTCDPTTTDPTHTYTATAPAGWQFVSGTTNPQTAQIDTDRQNVTLTWTVEKEPLTCPSGTVPSEDGTTCVQPEGPVEGGDPIIEEEEKVEEEQGPVIVDDPKDPVVVDDPVVEDGEAVCEGGLGLRVVDLLGEPVPGASVALGDETHSLTSGQHDETLPCGSVEVELTSVPGGYVFVRTEIHGTSTLSAQSTHTKSRKVSAVVSDDAPSTVVFVVDPLEVMPEEITEPAPERDPLGAPNPAPAQNDPQPAPQPAPTEPVAAPTLPRTGIPAGRLLALAILMLTAGGAMLGSRRSVDR